MNSAAILASVERKVIDTLLEARRILIESEESEVAQIKARIAHEIEQIDLELLAHSVNLHEQQPCVLPWREVPPFKAALLHFEKHPEPISIDDLARILISHGVAYGNTNKMNSVISGLRAAARAGRFIIDSNDIVRKK